ncbi:MAG: hypothetical protein RIR26_779 [Pseudomonadota bacterium]|jgi:hypothetical protein
MFRKMPKVLLLCGFCVAIPLNSCSQMNDTNQVDAKKMDAKKAKSSDSKVAIQSSTNLGAGDSMAMSTSFVKHLYEPPPNSTFIGSCSGGFKMPAAPDVLSDQGQAALTVLSRLVQDGKMQYCNESYSISDSGTSEPTLSSRLTVASEACTLDEKVAAGKFSRMDRCSAPESGLEEISSIFKYDASNALVYLYTRASISIKDLSDSDRAILKAGIKEILGAEVGSIPRRYTSELR